MGFGSGSGAGIRPDQMTKGGEAGRAALNGLGGFVQSMQPGGAAREGFKKIMPGLRDPANSRPGPAPGSTFTEGLGPIGKAMQEGKLNKLPTPNPHWKRRP